jgi:hypothetical protein
MSDEFPPRATREAEVDLLVEVFASVVANRAAIYVSSPLTTGQRAFEWHRGDGSPRRAQQDAGSDEFRVGVIEPNRGEAARYAAALRMKLQQVIVDPTAMADLPGWNQADYRVFWGRVIGRYAEAVVFREGWHYSSGCAYEFLVACATGSRLLREDLTPLTVKEGQRLLRQSIEESAGRGVSPAFLEGVRDALDNPTGFVFQA